MKKYLFLTCFFVVSCGGDDYFVPQPKGRTTVEKPDGQPVAYSFSKIEKSCFSCHNSSAPKIPLDEKGFKASKKVRARIEDGTMPPSQKDWDKKKALEYLDS